MRLLVSPFSELCTTLSLFSIVLVTLTAVILHVGLARNILTRHRKSTFRRYYTHPFMERSETIRSICNCQFIITFLWVSYPYSKPGKYQKYYHPPYFCFSSKMCGNSPNFVASNDHTHKFMRHSRTHVNPPNSFSNCSFSSPSTALHMHDNDMMPNLNILCSRWVVPCSHGKTLGLKWI